MAEQEVIYAFVKFLFNETVDLSSLTQRIIREKFAEHKGVDVTQVDATDLDALKDAVNKCIEETGEDIEIKSDNDNDDANDDNGEEIEDNQAKMQGTKRKGGDGDSTEESSSKNSPCSPQAKRQKSAAADDITTEAPSAIPDSVPLKMFTAKEARNAGLGSDLNTGGEELTFDSEFRVEIGADFTESGDSEFVSMKDMPSENKPDEMSNSDAEVKQGENEVLVTEQSEEQPDANTGSAGEMDSDGEHKSKKRRRRSSEKRRSKPSLLPPIPVIEKSEYCVKLEKIVKACGRGIYPVGINNRRFFGGCDTSEKREEKLFELLQRVDMEGEPTMKKAAEIRLLREAKELNIENIIQQPGRGQRKVSSLYSSYEPPPKEVSLSEVKAPFAGLKGIVDSDSESEDERKAPMPVILERTDSDFEPEVPESENRSPEPEIRESESNDVEPEMSESQNRSPKPDDSDNEDVEPEIPDVESKGIESEISENESKDTGLEIPESESKDAEPEIPDSESKDTEREIPESESKTTEPEIPESESKTTEPEIPRSENEKNEPENTESNNKISESEIAENESKVTESEVAERDTSTEDHAHTNADNLS